MPGPPYQYRSKEAVVLDLSELGATIQESEDVRQVAYNLSRKVQIATVRARDAMEQSGSLIMMGDASVAANKMKTALLDALTVGLVDSQENNNTQTNKARTPRPANLSNRVEDVVRLLAMSHFLETGGWLAPSQCASRRSNVDSNGSEIIFHVTDEEYLGGACMGLCQDLQRYGLGRATARDATSVQAARDLVQQILDYLLQFDFRNGSLRRKYDGTKYALKTLETVLYELSVTGADDVALPQAKKIRIDDSGSGDQQTTALQEELDGLRSRMDHRDELREKLIKRCRDGQKAAKQAIYALHRDDAAKSFKLLKECEDCIRNDLLPIVEEEPPLRSGSFANVLEEYAEAKMFYVWLLGKDALEAPSQAKVGEVAANGALLMPNDFDSVVTLQPEEYLGGLCDLTGEIGRYAVQRGTTRDEDGVKACLEANRAVWMALQTLERSPSSIGKKMDQLRRSVEKIERMLYEMSLSRAAGMKIATDVTETVDEEANEE